MYYVSNRIHDNANLVNFIKSSLTEGCLVYPVYESASFEVLFYFKITQPKLNQNKETKFILLCMGKMGPQRPTTIFGHRFWSKNATKLRFHIFFHFHPRKQIRDTFLIGDLRMTACKYRLIMLIS